MLRLFKERPETKEIERLREELRVARQERDRLAADLKKIYDIARETRPAWVEKEF